MSPARLKNGNVLRQMRLIPTKGRDGLYHVQSSILVEETDGTEDTILTCQGNKMGKRRSLQKHFWSLLT
jgi:hypothetical protein